METIFFAFFGYLFLTTAGLYIFGFLLLKFSRLVPAGRFTAIFCSLAVGQTAFILLFSAAVTGFETINLAFIPLAAFLWYGFRDQRQKLVSWKGSSGVFRHHGLNLLFLALPGFFIYAIRYWFGFGMHEYPVVHNDIIYYGKLSHYLLRFGVETYNIEYFYPQVNGAQPYHYFELWLNAGLLRIFQAPGVSLLYLVSYSFGLVTVWAGICALFETRYKVTAGIAVLAFLGLFLTGIHFTKLQRPFFDLNYSLQFNPFFLAKLYPVYLFLIGGALLCRHGRVREACYLLLMLPFVSVAAAPGAFAAAGLFAGWFFWRGNNKDGFRLLGATIAAATFYALFYTVFGPSSADPYQGHFMEIFLNLFTAENLDSAFWLTWAAPLQVLINYGPFVLILYLFSGFRPRFKMLIKDPGMILAMTLVFTALLSWALLNRFLDSFQFFTNTAIPLVNILVLIWIVFSLEKAYKMVMLILPLVLALQLNILITVRNLKVAPEHGGSYIKAVLAATRGLEPIGGFLKAPADYGNIFAKSSNVFAAGSYMIFSPHHAGFHTIDLSVFDIPAASARNTPELEEEIVANTSFYRFVAEQKKAHTFRSVPESQKAAVDAFKLDYIIVSKGAALPELLRRRVQKELQDPVSGEKFYILNRE